MIDVTVAAGTVQRCVDQLRQTAAELGEGSWAERFAALEKRLKEGQLTLAVLGQFKRGKSTLINALLGAELLPTAVVPLTSVVTVLEYGPEPVCLLRFIDGRESPAPLEALWEYATEAANPKNEKGVREILVQYPAPLLTRGVRIIDTPGIGSVYEHNTEVTLGSLPRVDAALFVLSVDPPLTKVELEFLNEARAYAGKILFVLNKVDAFNQAAVNEAFRFTEGALKSVIDREAVEILPLSAREGLASRLDIDDELLESSGLSALEERLSRFLRRERAATLSLAVAKAAAVAGREFAFMLRLSEEAVRMPAEVLEQKIKAFSLELARADISRREILGLVETEGEAIREKLEEDLAAFRERASDQIFQKLSDRIVASGDPLRRARAEAEQQLEHLIGEVFTPWVESETARVNEAFVAGARRLEGRVREHLEAVRGQAADLFDIPMPAAAVDLGLAEDSSLYYVVGDPGPFLPMPEWRDVVVYLPRRYALPQVLSILRREVWSEVDRNSGRVRYDLMERLSESTQRLRSTVVALLQDEVDGLLAALQAAQARSSQGRNAVEARLTVLGEARSRVERCLGRLEELM